MVCGFQGTTETNGDYEHGAITTLGRGGSDTTASALGSRPAGLCRGDLYRCGRREDGGPVAGPKARTLDVCTYEEVAEIAHQGAKVVHPRAAEIAMDHNIPLWVKSTFSEAPGTVLPTTMRRTPRPPSDRDHPHGQTDVLAAGAAAKQPEHSAAATLRIGFNVDDVDGATATLKGRGVRFTHEPTLQPREGIKLGLFVDPDGMPISIAQTLRP